MRPRVARSHPGEDGAAEVMQYLSMPRPERGRLFAPDEYGLGAQSRMILTHRLWSTHFARDPDVAGTTVRVRCSWGSPPM